MKISSCLLLIPLLSCPVSVFAQADNPVSPEAFSSPPGAAFPQPADASDGNPFANPAAESGWFVGVGGSFNSVRLDQDFNDIGNSNVFTNGALVATGTATGPAPPFHDTKTTFAPVAELGYFRNFEDSDWLWGGKFSYKYLGLTFSYDNFDAPQTGSFTTTSDPPTTTDFTGNAFTLSAQGTVGHELLLLPFIGHNFTNGRFYVGGGPVVFDTQSRLYGLYSYADINGQHTDIGGAPLNLASNKWMWGGAGQIGLTYSLHPNWFLDVNYSFMVTGSNTTTFPVNTTSTSGDTTYVTDIQYILVQRIWAQSLTVTLNLKF